MKAEYLEHGGVRLIPENFDEQMLLGNMRENGIVCAASSSGRKIDILDLKRFGYGNKQLILNEEQQTTVANALGLLLGIAANGSTGVEGYLISSILDQLTKHNASAHLSRTSGMQYDPMFLRPVRATSIQKAPYKELTLEEASDIMNKEWAMASEHGGLAEWLYSHGYAIVQKPVTKVEENSP